MPLVFPIGKADSLSGVVDLLENKAYMSGSQEPQAVPDSESAAVAELREMLVESACELDDDLINKYLEGEEITTDELSAVLRIGIRDQKLFPVLAGSGARAIGLEPLLNAIVHLLPSPVDVEAPLANGKVLAPSDKLAALVASTRVRYRPTRTCGTSRNRKTSASARSFTYAGSHRSPHRAWSPAISA